MYKYVQELPLISECLNIDLKAMRDDYYPLAFGGNKSRKMEKIINDIELNECNAVITTGGTQSNHARVVALTASAKGWPCTLVLHSKLDYKVLSYKANYFLMKISGAKIILVNPDDISKTMEEAKNEYILNGYKPYIIPGGGHCLQGALALYETCLELEKVYKKYNWKPDWIILPSGTGTTQAGVLAGIEKLGWHTHVVGISVARQNPRGKAIIDQSYHEIRDYLKLMSDSREVDFRDSWVGRGYEQADSKVLSNIRWAAKKEGLILDPTYTGKAFTGLLDMIKAGEITKGSKVLFWVTGGLMNLLAAENYFEELINNEVEGRK